MTHSGVGEPPPTGEPPTDARAARERVASQFGRALADKASDRYCLVTARTFAFDDLPRDIVYARPPTPFGELFAPAVLTFSLDSHPTGAALRNIDGRRRRVAALRDAAYGAMQPAYDQIERMTLGSISIDRALTHGPSLLINQICWLNRTMRTYGPPHTLAEVAEDPSIEEIDLPHRLVADGCVPSLDVVGAGAYQTKHQLDGSGITVAVIDGEIDAHHSALAGRVVQKRNFTAEGWGHPDAHATAIAGLIASSDHTHGGAAPNATLINYKVLSPTTVAQNFDGYLALQEALNDDADIANCSWGVGPGAQGQGREATAVDLAWAAGMVVIKSAGNNGPWAATITSPADADGIIVVGATDRDGHAVTDYSSRGPVRGRPGPHLVAPGGTADAPLTVAQVGGGFHARRSAWGTSFAAPHAAGLAALLLAEDSSHTPDSIRDRLVACCTPLAGCGADAQGAGLVQLQ